MSPLDSRSDSCGPSRGFFRTWILAKTGGQEEITDRSAVVPRLHSTATDHNSLTAIVRCVPPEQGPKLF